MLFILHQFFGEDVNAMFILEYLKISCPLLTMHRKQ